MDCSGVFLVWRIGFIGIISACVFYARPNRLLGLAAELFYWLLLAAR
jgi:hypothetical protein